MTRRKLFGGAVLSAGALLLAACGSDEGTEAVAPQEDKGVPGAVEPGSMKEQRTVTIATSSLERQTTAEVIRLWNNDGISLAADNLQLAHVGMSRQTGKDVLSQQQNTVKTFLTSQAAAGTSPDMVTVGWLADFAWLFMSDLVQPLDRYVQNDRRGSIEQFSDEALRLVDYQHQMMMLPYDVTMGMVRYLPKMFSAANVPFPSKQWTREEFVVAAKQLTIDRDDDGTIDQWGFAAFHYYPDWLPFVLQEGVEDVVDLNTGTVRLTESSTLRALRFWDELGRVHGILPYGPDLVAEQLRPLDRSRRNRVAVFFDNVPDAAVGDGRQYALLPAGPKEITPLVLVEAIGVPTGANDPDLSYSALVPFALHLGERSRLPSVKAGVRYIENPDTDHINLHFAEEDRQLILHAFSTAKASHVASSHGMSNGLFHSLMLPLARGELVVEQAAEQAASWVSAYLEGKAEIYPEPSCVTCG